MVWELSSIIVIVGVRAVHGAEWRTGGRGGEPAPAQRRGRARLRRLRGQRAAAARLPAAAPAAPPAALPDARLWYIFSSILYTSCCPQLRSHQFKT